MRTLFFMAFAAALAVTSGCSDDQNSSHPFSTHNVQPIDGAGSAFTLPSKNSIQIIQHGSGLGRGDYSEAKDFSVTQAKGKWQIWIAHNVWSVWSVSNDPGDFVLRNNSIAAALSAINETREVNGLDFEINFLQLDRPGAVARAASSKDNLAGMSPPGGSWCDFFWVYCADRYVIAPFSRNQEKETLSQRQWLSPYIEPVFDDIERNGSKSRHATRAEKGIQDENSEYWDRIHMMAFIVNPDGIVVDALIPLANGQGVSALGVITRYLAAADIDFEDIKIPQDNNRSGFKTDFLYANAPVTKFGGDYAEATLESIREIFFE